MLAKIRILFVDDETKVLHGLRRTLYSMSEVWDMFFAASGPEALALLEQTPESIDVLVTDMRMPGMDGIELLREVKRQYPQIIRIVLSGQENQETVIRTVGLTHQYLSKPCDIEILKSTIIQAYTLRDLLETDELKKLIAQMESLPSLPALYNELLMMLGSTEVSIKEIGYIISQDIGMAAKVLQLVNSAFFGLRRHISDPHQAVLLLGVDTIKALVLSAQVFSQLNGVSKDHAWLSALQKHSLAAGAFAKRIAEAETSDRWLTDYAFTAGLLHDIGKLALVASLPKAYISAQALAGENNLPILDAERQIFGATHTEVGAYLLGLWGLPNPVIEAVAYHHHPGEQTNNRFTSLTAVHVANVLAHELYPLAEMYQTFEIDHAYLTKLNLLDRLPEWRTICKKTISEDKP